MGSLYGRISVHGQRKCTQKISHDDDDIRWDFAMNALLSDLPSG